MNLLLVQTRMTRLVESRSEERHALVLVRSGCGSMGAILAVVLPRARIRAQVYRCGRRRRRRKAVDVPLAREEDKPNVRPRRPLLAGVLDRRDEGEARKLGRKNTVSTVSSTAQTGYASCSEDTSTSHRRAARSRSRSSSAGEDAIPVQRWKSEVFHALFVSTMPSSSVFAEDDHTTVGFGVGVRAAAAAGGAGLLQRGSIAGRSDNVGVCGPWATGGVRGVPISSIPFTFLRGNAPSAAGTVHGRCLEALSGGLGGRAAVAASGGALALAPIPIDHARSRKREGGSLRLSTFSSVCSVLMFRKDFGWVRPHMRHTGSGWQ